jgi:hypothetical protein
MAAQVREFLAEKYPGQDTSRVANGFMRRFSHPISPLQKIDASQQQKYKRGIGV